MTKLLEKAIEVVRTLSVDRQDAIARQMLDLADIEDDAGGEEIAAADLDSVMQGLDDARNGRFATDAEVEAAFRRFRR